MVFIARMIEGERRGMFNVEEAAEEMRKSLPGMLFYNRIIDTVASWIKRVYKLQIWKRKNGRQALKRSIGLTSRDRIHLYSILLLQQTLSLRDSCLL